MMMTQVVKNQDPARQKAKDSEVSGNMLLLCSIMEIEKLVVSAAECSLS